MPPVGEVMRSLFPEVLNTTPYKTIDGVRAVTRCSMTQQEIKNQRSLFFER
jgi:hypothetical protein